MLSLMDIKRILNPSRLSLPGDDFRVLDSWLEFEGEDGKSKKEQTLKYMCFEIETMDPETGKVSHLYKALKFARVIRLPKSARQSTSFMDMQTQVLSAAHEQGYNMVTIIANMIHPVPEGLLFLYGVQGVSDDIEEAKERADRDYSGLVHSFMGTFRVLHMRTITAEESMWLKEKMRSMRYMTAVRGIPKANQAGEDMGNKGVGGTNLNPNSEGTLEEIITAMADYEYVIEVLSTPVYNRTLMAWQTRTQKQMTDWYGQLQGTKSLSFNLSIPMTYMTSTGSSQGWSRNYTDSKSVSYTHGTSYNSGYSENVGHSLSQSLGESFGKSQGTSLTNTTGTSYTQSTGKTHGLTQGYTNGVTQGQTYGQTVGQTLGKTVGYTQGISKGVSHGMSVSTSKGNNIGVSANTSKGFSLGSSAGTNSSNSFSNGLSQGYSMNQTRSQNSGVNAGQNIGNSTGKNLGQSNNLSHSLSANKSAGYGTNNNVTVGNSASTSQSAGVSNNKTFNKGVSANSNISVGGGLTQSSGLNTTHSEGDTDSRNWGGSIQPLGIGFNGGSGHSDNTTDSDGVTNNNSLSSNATASGGVGTNYSAGASSGTTFNQGVTQSQNIGSSNGYSENYSAGTGESYSLGNGSSYGESFGASAGQSQGSSYSNGVSEGQGTNIGNSMSASASSGVSTGSSFGQSASGSTGNSAGQSYSVTVAQNTSTSFTSSASQSVSQSSSQSYSESLSDSMSKSYSTSNSESMSDSQSESLGQSKSQSRGESLGESYTQSMSNGTGQSWGESTSSSSGKSYGTSNGESTGTSVGNTGSFTNGTSGSMGLGPSIGYSKSYQWLDQQVKDILELLEFENERLKKALRGNGAFYTYVYIACESIDALSAAQAAAKATWQNEYAMTNPLQVMDLEPEEQQHLMYHFTAFSADVTRENVAGISTYKYATVLLPGEYVAYTHLPRVSEGGIDVNVEDIPKFRVPGFMRGEIYMGTQLNSERFTFKNGYRTQFEYRVKIDELMHGLFTGQSRSGKTVAAMRFIKELAACRRTDTGKRLRIVIMDPKQDWRGIARFVEPERFRFYSMGNPHFRAINLNPCKIPYGVEPQHWIDGIVNIYCRSYGLLERGKQMIADVFFKLYEAAGCFREDDAYDSSTWHKDELGNVISRDWFEEVSWRSSKVTFHKLYKDMHNTQESFSEAGKRTGNDTLDAYARLLERLSCFSRKYSIEYRLFSAEGLLQPDGTVLETSEAFEDPAAVGTGLGVDELIGEDDVTVFESFGLESTFASFIFGIITSGFYKYAKGFERGYLHPSQYETVLVIEEANKVLTGTDTAGTGGNQSASLSGQSEFEEILDQSAGYGLFIIAITQKISMMPSSVIANCGLLFIGKIAQPEDVDLAVRMIGREGRMDDRDVVKWFPKSPTGWFVCRSNRGYDFRDAEPVLIAVEALNKPDISNAELDEILYNRDIARLLAS